MDSIAEIASSLTERQKTVLMAGEGSVGVCRRLREKGLADRVEGSGMAWSADIHRSVLGDLVLRFLVENGDG